MPLIRRAFLALPVLTLPVLALTAAGRATDAVRRVNHADGVALKGYDATAWHLQQEPRRGSPAHAHEWAGVTWHFATAALRDRFAAEPDRYAPRFGGFCALGVAQGYKVDIDPEAWHIVQGCLYLNYSRGVHRQWARDIAGNIARAEANWPRLADV
jgi:hypothetical protein